MVQLADSDLLQIGDWVLAIGHPLGMGSTLTHGIVSALGRQAGIFNRKSDEENRYAIESFIQTNAVINPGNSGGPLLDLQGRVRRDQHGHFNAHRLLHRLRAGRADQPSARSGR